MTAPARRRRSERAGRRAETLAALFLRLKGYRIVERRYRQPVGEIDLIARRGRTVAFVEVKHRARLDAAAEGVTMAGRRRLVAAARFWLASHPAAAACDLRFDVVLTAPYRWPRHLAGAFDAEHAA